MNSSIFADCKNYTIPELKKLLLNILALIFITTYSCETFSILVKSYTDSNLAFIADFDNEKETSDNEDTKESKEKWYTNEMKGFKGVSTCNKEANNRYGNSCRLSVSSDYSSVVYSPPEFI